MCTTECIDQFALVNYVQESERVSKGSRKEDFIIRYSSGCCDLIDEGYTYPSLSGGQICAREE